MSSGASRGFESGNNYGERFASLRGRRRALASWSSAVLRCPGRARRGESPWPPGGAAGSALRASARSPRVRVACKTRGCRAWPGCGARGAGAQWRGAGPSLSRFVRAPSLVHRFGRQHAVPARRSRVEELGHVEGLDPESERDAAAAGPPVPSFKRGECVLSVGRNKASEPRFAYTQCSHYQRSLVRLPRPRPENDF